MGNLIALMNSQSFSEVLAMAMPSCPQKKDEDGGLNDEYKSYVYTVEQSVEFTWENNFITVEISVWENVGEKFAKELLESVTTEVPKYVIKNIMLPDGYTETRCEKFSSIDELVKVEK
jgi:hypothetical protein